MRVRVPPFALTANVETQARTLQPPRRSADRVAFVFLAIAALACQPGVEAQARAQVAAAIGHVTAAVQMLEAANGDQRKLLDAALAYRSAHHAELHALRTAGEQQWAQLDPPTRARLTAEADAQTRPLLARLTQAAQRFADPRQALMLVQPFLLPASAQPGPANWRPWLPPQPPLPAALVDAPQSATGTSR